jgi:Tol biopolymer transport system component
MRVRRWMGTLLACGVMGLGLATAALAQMDDAPPPTPGLIAFVQKVGLGAGEGPASILHIPRGKRSYENEWDRYAYDIGTIRPDGSDRRLLTSDGWSRAPQWSWDGEWLAYATGTEPQMRVAVMRADGSDHKILLEREQAIEAYWWSHDNARLMVAVESNRAGPRGAQLLEGRVVDIDSGKTSRLSNSDWMRGWNHWEPGERKPVNPRRRLLQALQGVARPYWSPDAEHIAFVYDGALALAPVDTTGDTGNWFLRNDEPPASEIYEWSQDGSKLLFAIGGDPRRRTGSFLVLADREGDAWGDAQVVTTRNVVMVRPAQGVPQNATPVAMDSRATRVAVLSAPPGYRNAEIYVVDIATGADRRVTHSRVDHMDVAWQPRP